MHINPNMADRHNLELLLQQYADNRATPEQLEQLSALLAVETNEQEIIGLLAAMVARTEIGQEAPGNDIDGMIQRILDQSKSDQARVRRLAVGRRMMRWVAAACVIALLGTGVYFILMKNTPTGRGNTATVKDIQPPDRSRATITLSNGNQIYLDEAANGILAQEGNTRLVKSSEGQVTYQDGGGSDAPEVQYNTLSNPRGSKVIDITLTDGTRVWLNAGSSIVYPLSFTGNVRQVTVSGEAYFEVSHDKSKPFHVSNKGLEITVLGTHFNVNAYEDEDRSVVTLLEGSVRISTDRSHAGSGVVIRPGEQASARKDGTLAVAEADTDQAVAWKNGFFQFNSLGVEQIMREISRWYDVDVEYELRPGNKHFSGILSRQGNITSVLRIMEQSGIHFRIEGKKVKVTE